MGDKLGNMVRLQICSSLSALISCTLLGDFALRKSERVDPRDASASCVSWCMQPVVCDLEGDSLCGTAGASALRRDPVHPSCIQTHPERSRGPESKIPVGSVSADLISRDTRALMGATVGFSICAC